MRQSRLDKSHLLDVFHGLSGLGVEGGLNVRIVGIDGST